MVADLDAWDDGEASEKTHKPTCVSQEGYRIYPQMFCHLCVERISEKYLDIGQVVSCILHGGFFHQWVWDVRNCFIGARLERVSSKSWTAKLAFILPFKYFSSVIVLQIQDNEMMSNKNYQYQNIRSDVKFEVSKSLTHLTNLWNFVEDNAKVFPFWKCIVSRIAAAWGYNANPLEITSLRH